MDEELAMFDLASAAKIARVVRHVHAMGAAGEDAKNPSPTLPVQIIQITSRISTSAFYNGVIVGAKSRDALLINGNPIECVVEAISGEKFKTDETQFLLCRFAGQHDDTGLGLFIPAIPVKKEEFVTDVQCGDDGLVVTYAERFVLDFDEDAD